MFPGEGVNVFSREPEFRTHKKIALTGQPKFIIFPS